MLGVRHDRRLMTTVAPAGLLDAPLRDTAGEVTTLRAQLGPSATVVVFLRHYG